MNMYGWTTWGKCRMNGAPDQPEFQVFKHWTGPLVAVDESIPRDEAFLMLAQMNEHLEAVQTPGQVRQARFLPGREYDTNEPYDVPCGSDHCRECR